MKTRDNSNNNNNNLKNGNSFQIIKLKDVQDVVMVHGYIWYCVVLFFGLHYQTNFLVTLHYSCVETVMKNNDISSDSLKTCRKCHVSSCSQFVVQRQSHRDANVVEPRSRITGSACCVAGLDTDGIYRVSGNLAVIQKLRFLVNHGKEGGTEMNCALWQWRK